MIPARRRISLLVVAHYLTLIVLLITALVTISRVEPAAGQDPLPAGYERMIQPGAKHVATFNFKEDWTSDYSSVAYNWSFHAGHRVLDLEIDDFDPKPNTEEGYSGGHRISTVEVPNEGTLACDNWMMALGETAEVMKLLLNPPLLDFGVPVS